MRINAGNTDLSRCLAGAINSSAKNKSNPFLISSKDSLNISKVGGQLGLQGNFFIRWDKTITKPGDDPALRLMDNSISSVGKVLEQMRSISELAQDERLTDLDRIDLQIEMDRLQKKLTVETRRMSLVMAGKSEKEISGMLEGPESQQGNDVLLRARERILNGEKWDVAEKFEPTMVLREVHVITAEERQVIQIQDGESFELSPDIDPKDVVVLKIHDWTGGKFVVTEDKSVPTVSQMLEMDGGISLMDAKSAIKGTERIEKQIEDLLEMREEFAAFYKKNEEELPQAGQDGSALNDAEVEELVNSINRDKLERENQTEGGAMGEENTDETTKKTTVETRLGLMEYSNALDPRLVRPKNRIGAMFAKIESLFKDKIAKNVGIHALQLLKVA